MRGCFGPWSRTRETPPRSASKDGDRGAGGVGLAADQQGYWRLDKLIAVPRLLGDELQDDQAKVAVGEEAAEASSASLPTMRTAVVVVVLQPNPLDFVLRLAVRTCDHKAWSCAGIACVRARRHWRDRR